MQVTQAVLMGFIQGLTEFLPVSSSGHIVFMSTLYKFFTGVELNFVGDEEIFFDILIHLATLLAIIIYFYKDIILIIKGFFCALINKNYNDKNFKFGIYILISTFMTCIIAFFIQDFAHRLIENPFFVSLLLIVTGIMLFVSEKVKNKNKDMNCKIAVITGVFQGLAILPGISRSGSTISSAVFMGVSRVEAAKFSFILSIPIILIASFVYPLSNLDTVQFENFNICAIITGMVTSFIVGYFCIKYFMKFVEKHSLKWFSIYCVIAGLIAAFLLF